jgi:hypothetical protein
MVSFARSSGINLRSSGYPAAGRSPTGAHRFAALRSQDQTGLVVPCRRWHAITDGGKLR